MQSLSLPMWKSHTMPRSLFRILIFEFNRISLNQLQYLFNSNSLVNLYSFDANYIKYTFRIQAHDFFIVKNEYRCSSQSQQS